MSENKAIALALVLCALGVLAACIFGMRYDEQRREKCAERGGSLVKAGTSYLCVTDDGRIVKT